MHKESTSKMTKKIVAYHFKQIIDIKLIDKLDLFAETMQATFDMTTLDGQTNKVELNLYFENDSFLNINNLQAELSKIIATNALLTPIYENDWQKDFQQPFEPIEVAPFYIYSEKGQQKDGAINLQIPAKMAFGTGEHATTHSCLTLYSKLNKQGFKFKNCLDMGCGSAILAMAFNKLDQTSALGIDIDLAAVDIAHENLLLNNINANLDINHGNGFNDPIVTENKPYDLIFANIFKNPLLEMAQDLYSVLSPNGIAIISGFKTERQKDEILNKYVNELGLTLLNCIDKDSWTALALQKD